MPALPYWFWPGDDRPTEEIDDEIAAELRLHLDLLEEEQARQGVPHEEAKRNAAKRFGDFDTVLRRCRAEKQGDLPMLKRIQTVLTLLLFVGVVFLGVRDYVTASTTAQYMDQTTDFLQSIQGDLAELRGNLETKSSLKDFDNTRILYDHATSRKSFRLQVQDEKGEPISRPTVVVHDHQKTNGWYVMPFRTIELDEGGRGEIVEPNRTFSLTVIAQGYASDSFGGPFRLPSPDFALPVVLSKATPFELRVMNTDGEPVRRMSLVLRKRTDLEGRTIGPFPSDTPYFRKMTDDDGRSTIDWLLPRDIATIAMQERGSDNNRKVIEFEVPQDPSGGLTVWLTRNGAVVGDEPPQQQRSASGKHGGKFGGVAYGEVAARARTKADLTGAVTHTNGKPVADADVLLIIKTWPNNRFRQDDYAVKTDASGVFQLKGRIPLDGQYGINAAVVAEGQAIASRYVLVEDPAGQPPAELSFKLEPSVETLIILTDPDGEPIARALVAPSGRVASDDTEHNVYHQGSNPVWMKTDAEGAVTIDWFAEGDLGKINIRPRGGDWQERKIDLAQAINDGVTFAIED